MLHSTDGCLLLLCTTEDKVIDESAQSRSTCVAIDSETCSGLAAFSQPSSNAIGRSSTSLVRMQARQSRCPALAMTSDILEMGHEYPPRMMMPFKTSSRSRCMSPSSWHRASPSLGLVERVSVFSQRMVFTRLGFWAHRQSQAQGCWCTRKCATSMEPPIHGLAIRRNGQWLLKAEYTSQLPKRLCSVWRASLKQHSQDASRPKIFI